MAGREALVRSEERTDGKGPIAWRAEYIAAGIKTDNSRDSFIIQA